MKRSILIIALGAIIVTGFGSCKKDWNCSCTDQSGNQTSTVIKDETILNARNHCTAMDYDYTVGGVHTSKSCSIK